MSTIRNTTAQRKCTLFVIFVLTFFGCRNNSIEIELLHDTSTFDATITSLSYTNADSAALWLGFENGDIVWKKDAEHKVYLTDTKARIYDIYDCGDSTLLVGMRNEGVRLYDLRELKNGAWNKCKIQFTIPDVKEPARGTRYSIYSIAYDDSTKTFFVGSSNGIYALHSDSLCKSKLDTISLKQRVDKQNEEDSINVIGFFKLIVNKRFILAQGDKYGESNNDKHKYKIDNDFQEYPIVEYDANILNPQYMQFDGIDSTEYFTLIFNEIKFKKDGQKFVHNQPLAVHEEKNWMRALKFDNFIYVACHRKLYAFYLHQNTAKTSNSVLAVSSTLNKGAAYFITGDLCLHKYTNNDDDQGKIKGLEGKVKGNILKFIFAGDDKEEKFYLATDKHLFEIKNNIADEITWNQNDIIPKGDNNRITDIHWANNKELYIGTRNFLAKYSKGTLRKITTNGLETTDLYVVSICGDKSYYVSTLNRGIYEIKIENEKDIVISKFDFNQRIWASSNIGKFDTTSTYGTVLDFVEYGNTFLLNTTKGLVKLYGYHNESKKYQVRQFKNNRTVKSLFWLPSLNTKSEKDYIIFDYKGFKQLSLEDSIITEKRKFSDISFDKNKIAVLKDNTILLGTDVGLFKWKFSVPKDEKNLIPVTIDKQFSTPDWVKFVITLSIVIIAGIFIILVFFLKWKDERLKKEISNTEIDRLKNRLNVEIEEKKKVIHKLSEEEEKISDLIHKLDESEKEKSELLSFKKEVEDKNTETDRLKNEEITGIKIKLQEWINAKLEQIEKKWNECSDINSDSHTFIEKKNEIEKTLSDIKQQETPNKVDIDNLEQEVNGFCDSYSLETQIKADIERINEIYKECDAQDQYDADRQKRLKEEIAAFINKYRNGMDIILSTERHWYINHALILCLIENIELTDICSKITYLGYAYMYDRDERKNILTETHLDAKRISHERRKRLDAINTLVGSESPESKYKDSAILLFMKQKYTKDRNITKKK